MMQGIIPDIIIRDNHEQCGYHENPKTMYYRHVRELDVKFQTDGKVENRLKAFGKDGTDGGVVCGAFGEYSSHMHRLDTFVSKNQTAKMK